MDKRYDKTNPLADPPYSDLNREDKAQAQADQRALEAKRATPKVDPMKPPTATNKTQEAGKQPAVGSIVTFYDKSKPVSDGLGDPIKRAALVTKLNPDTGGTGDAPTVSLAVYLEHGIRYEGIVAYSDKPKVGCWGWGTAPRV